MTSIPLAKYIVMNNKIGLFYMFEDMAKFFKLTKDISVDLEPILLIAEENKSVF